MSNRLDQQREAELQPKRMEFAETSLGNLGYEITFKSNTEIRFVFRGGEVRLFPYSGWHSGPTIKDGRGIQNLLNQLK